MKTLPSEAADDVAAVDLGSNSFHMLVARKENGQLRVLDRLRETVRLAAGLLPDGTLDAEAQARAADCLARFGQRLRGIPTGRVRAVGTNTLRKLDDGGRFAAAAERMLGHEIEVISGGEEARLVYSGVVRGVGEAPPRRLVIDIGGGSTELIVGHRMQPRLMESVGMGCVTYTRRYFGDGVVNRARLQQARLAARVEVEFLEQRYRRAGWDVAIGASGTVRGAWRVMQAQGWADELITRDALERTLARTAAVGRIDRIEFAGLREDRRPVFAGGLAVLAGVFDALALDAMRTSDHALREGVVYDLLGRLSNRDVRSTAVEAMARRYGADRRQARAVERTALRLLAADENWPLERPPAARLLSWAAQLHEIGLAVSHDGYPRHGEYLLRHGDLAGFSRTDQQLLATLVRLQRGRFSRGIADDVPRYWREPVLRLAVLFRLAVLLHRSRMPLPRLPFVLETKGRRLQLSFADGWLEQRPLTRTDLERECETLRSARFRLAFE